MLLGQLEIRLMRSNINNTVSIYIVNISWPLISWKQFLLFSVAYFFQTYASSPIICLL